MRGERGYLVSMIVQPQCLSAQTRGHQQEVEVVEQTQEHSWLENILPGGQSVLSREESHLQVQDLFWKVARPGQEVFGPWLQSQPQERSSSTVTMVVSQPPPPPSV